MANTEEPVEPDIIKEFELSKTLVSDLEKKYNRYVKKLEFYEEPLTFKQYVYKIYMVTVLNHEVLLKANYKTMLEKEIKEIDVLLMPMLRSGFNPNKKLFNEVNNYTIKKAEEEAKT